MPKLPEPFDPSKNLELVALRSAWREVGPDKRDQPDYIAHSIDAEGTVRVRPLTLEDIFAWVERKCEGEVE